MRLALALGAAALAACGQAESLPCAEEERIQVQPYFRGVRTVELDGSRHAVLAGMSEIHVHPVRDDGTVALEAGWVVDEAEGSPFLLAPLEPPQAALPGPAGGVRVVAATRIVDLPAGSKVGTVVPLAPGWLEDPSSFRVELVVSTPSAALLVWSGVRGGRWVAGLGRLSGDGAVEPVGAPFLEADPPPRPGFMGIDGGWDPEEQRLVVVHSQHRRAAAITADGVVEREADIDPAWLCSLPYVREWIHTDAGWYGLHGSWLCRFDPFGRTQADKEWADLIGGSTYEAALHLDGSGAWALGTRQGAVTVRRLWPDQQPRLGEPVVTQVLQPYEACPAPIFRRGGAGPSP